jgi:hypothetical protein
VWVDRRPEAVDTNQSVKFKFLLINTAFRKTHVASLKEMTIMQQGLIGGPLKKKPIQILVNCLKACAVNEKLLGSAAVTPDWCWALSSRTMPDGIGQGMEE